MHKPRLKGQYRDEGRGKVLMWTANGAPLIQGKSTYWLEIKNALWHWKLYAG